jgi:hypothetical protein
MSLQHRLESRRAFAKYVQERREFDESIGLTDEVARRYQQELWRGTSREDAFAIVTSGLQLNEVTRAYVHDTLEKLPGPEESI